jgi:hypothetical protein
MHVKKNALISIACSSLSLSSPNLKTASKILRYIIGSNKVIVVCAKSVTPNSDVDILYVYKGSIMNVINLLPKLPIVKSRELLKSL